MDEPNKTDESKTSETKGNLYNIGIGEEHPPLEAATVTVKNVEIKTVQGKDGKDMQKVVLTIDHPKANDITLSKVKFEKNNKLTETGIWFQLDSDGKIPYKSALANLLRYYACQQVEDLKGKDIATIVDEGGYLLVKAY